jgi:hypothetical protein
MIAHTHDLTRSQQHAQSTRSQTTQSHTNKHPHDALAHRLQLRLCGGLGGAMLDLLHSASEHTAHSTHTRTAGVSRPTNATSPLDIFSSLSARLSCSVEPSVCRAVGWGVCEYNAVTETHNTDTHTHTPCTSRDEPMTRLVPVLT